MINILGFVTNYNKTTRNNILLEKIDTNFLILESPKIETKQSYNPEKLKTFNYDFKRSVRKFIQTLQSNNINLNVFFNNLGTLDIQNGNFFDNLVIFNNSWSGLYYGDKNKIKVLKRNNFVSIYHELLHCASSKKVNNHYFSGFSQRTPNTSVGIALTEGYTALLDKRYFNPNKNSYLIEQIVSEILESIVGQEKMEQLYFNADLYGLVEELKKYDTEQNIKLFLIYMDEILIRKREGIDLENLHTQSEFIAEFLSNCLLKSLNNKVNTGIISEEDMKEIYMNAIPKLSTSISINNKKFYLVDISKAFELTIRCFPYTRKKGL